MNAADLVATSLIIEAHAYDPELLACACGVSCLPPHHAMHVALELQGNRE